MNLGNIIGGIVGGPLGAVVGGVIGDALGGGTVGGGSSGIGSAIGGGILGGLFPPQPPLGQGTSGDDNVHISKVGGLFGGAGLYDVEMNGQHRWVTKQELESTTFNLGSGDDKLIVDADVDANITANGGSGDDVMIGGKGHDNFRGGSGDDYLKGGAGHDSLDGGSGDNTIVRDVADWGLPFPVAHFPELMRP